MSVNNDRYGPKPSAVINPLAHEVVPMGDSWECSGCKEVFNTLDAADNHEKAHQETYRF